MIFTFILCLTVVDSAFQHETKSVRYPNERSYVMNLRERDPVPKVTADIFSRGQARRGFDLIMKRITDEHKKMETNVQKIPKIVKDSIVETQTSMAIDQMKKNADICFSESIQTFDTSSSSSSSSSKENISTLEDSSVGSNQYESTFSHSFDIELPDDFHSSSSDYDSQLYSASSDYDDTEHSVEISGSFVSLESHSFSIDYSEDTRSLSSISQITSESKSIETI